MGVSVDRIGETQAIATALRGVESGHGGWICPTNLDVLRQISQQPVLRELVAEADLVVADGMPLIWASRLQGEPLPERVAGSSLIETLPAAAARAGASVFLLGGNPGVADIAAERLVERNPGLRIAGTECPPLGFEGSASELARIESRLRDTRPDIVFVALGFPKQELLIQRLRRALPSAWFVSCGASLSFVSGDLTRAPVWVQRLGLEWLHRLAHEPRRLARRYLLDGPPFLLRVIAGALRRRLPVLLPDQT